MVLLPLTALRFTSSYMDSYLLKSSIVFVPFPFDNGLVFSVVNLPVHFPFCILSRIDTDIYLLILAIGDAAGPGFSIRCTVHFRNCTI